MSSVGPEGPIKSPRAGPSSVGSRSTRPQQQHRRLNPASGNNTVVSSQSMSSKGPTSTHTAFALPQGVSIPSLIKEGGRLTEKPYHEPHGNSTFDNETKVWVATNVPKAVPDKREDVHHLENWLTERLSDLAASSASKVRSSDKLSVGTAAVAQQQLVVMNQGFFELVRQVGVQCSDRAELMLRMWRASQELFENVIRDLATTVTEMRHHAETWKEKHDALQKDMDILAWKHDRDLAAAHGESKTHKSEDSTVYRDMQDELYLREKDMNMMESSLSDLSIWFPNFQKYSSSNLRKQLPVANPDMGGKSHPLLPQEYFSMDMERARSMLDSIMDKGRSRRLSTEEGGTEFSTEASATSEEHKKMSESRLRELVVDNQIQEIVLKESESKLNRMTELEVVYKKRIDELAKENNFLQRKVSDSECATNLRSIPCFLKSPTATSTSVSEEIADLYLNNCSPERVPCVPPKMLSVGDLQASLHKCCSNFLSNKMALNWHVYKGSTNERGLDVVSGSAYWRLTGTMGGAAGPEMSINTFESLLSFYLLHQTRNKRLARECMRKASWSTLLWKNKMGAEAPTKAVGERDISVFNHLHSDTSKLPRQLGENEKSFMLCMSRLFGYFREEPHRPVLANSLFFNLFMRAFSTLQRYFKSPETPSSMLAPTSNLFVPASPSLVPLKNVNTLVRRLFGTPKKTKLYQSVEKRRYSRAVNLSVIQKIDLFGGVKVTQSNRTWWTCLPPNLLAKINEDVALYGQKQSGGVVEAYDFIEVMWKHVYEYYSSVRTILENIFIFLEAITSGPLDPMYSTLLLSFLETKDSRLTVEHNILAIEFISLHTQGLLNSTSFTDTILSKPGIFLTGLHILFDSNLRLMREFRREGLELLDNFKTNFIKYERESDFSRSENSSKDCSPKYSDSTYLARNVKRLSVIGRVNDLDFEAFQKSGHNSMEPINEEPSTLEEESSYYGSLVEDNVSMDSSSRQYDVLLSYAMYSFDEDSLEAKDDSALPYYLKCFDVYCAFVAMKCVSEFNEVTKTVCPIVEIDKVAKCIRHREVYLARVTFLAWFDYVEEKKLRAAAGEGDSDDDDEDSDDENGGKSLQSPSRRPAKAMEVFTIREE